MKIALYITLHDYITAVAGAAARGQSLPAALGLDAGTISKEPSPADVIITTPGDTAEDVETVAPARGTSGLLALASDDVSSFTPHH